MRYAGVIYFDTGNARGLSTTLFVQGCDHNCDECHNPDTHDAAQGRMFTPEVKEEVIKSLENPVIHNFILSGGDPLYYENRKDVLDLLIEIKNRGLDKNVILYTGSYITEDFLKENYVKEILSHVNYVIDGPYVKTLPTQSLDFRGSTNQHAFKITTTNEGYEITNYSEHYFRFPIESDKEEIYINVKM